MVDAKDGGGRDGSGGLGRAGEEGVSEGVYMESGEPNVQTTRLQEERSPGARVKAIRKRLSDENGQDSDDEDEEERVHDYELLDRKLDGDEGETMSDEEEPRSPTFPVFTANTTEYERERALRIYERRKQEKRMAMEAGFPPRDRKMKPTPNPLKNFVPPEEPRRSRRLSSG